jgi:hypothetical protein
MFQLRIRGGLQKRSAEGIRRLYSRALDRFQHSIRDVDLAVFDVNGPRGGEDKICWAQLRLLPRGVLVVRATGSSFVDAANAACERVREVLSRTLERRKSSRRREARGKRGVIPEGPIVFEGD